MNNRERHEIALKKDNIPPVEILTDEMKALAGLNTKYVPTFTSGTAGLRRITKEVKT